MKRLLMLGVALTVSIMVYGCMIAPVVPPQGLIFTNFKAPLDIDQSQTPVEQKAGQSSVTTILGMVSFGDGSLEAAAKDGGIKTIESADYQYLSVLLGLFTQYTTIVHGK